MTRGRTYRPFGSHLSMTGYLGVYAILKSSPHTAKTLGEASGAGQRICLRLLDVIHRMGVIHVAGWVQAKKGPHQPIYADGPAEDAKYPGKVQKPNLARMPNLMVKFCNALIALRKPMTCKELSEEAGMFVASANDLVNHGKTLGIVRVHRWLVRSKVSAAGAPIAVWGMGSEPDAPRPEFCPLKYRKVYNKKKTKELQAERTKDKEQKRKSLARANETLEIAKKIGGFSVFTFAQALEAA